MLLTFFLGAMFLSGGYIFMDRILSLFGATEGTITYAREYLLIVLPGMFLTTVTYNLTGLIRASGYPRKSMYILVSGAILNIILDAIFILVFRWGIAGAAWATTISMAVTAVASVAHFIHPGSFIRFRSHSWTPKLYIFKNIMLIGMSPFLMNVAASAVVAFENAQLIRYGGDLAVATIGVVNTFVSLMIMIIIGICQGMQPIAGYNYGSGHPDRLKEVFTLVMRIDVFIGFIAMTIGLSIPGLIGRLFTSDMELISMVKPCMRWLTVMMPLICMTITNSQFFMAVDKPWISIVTSLSRQVIFLLPMIYIVPAIFTHFGGDGLTGLWVSNTISDVTGAVLAVSLLLTQLRIFREAK